MYEYKYSHIRTIDGDTIVGKVDLGFNISVNQTFRLAGIDTPELNSSDVILREEANKAKEYVNIFFKIATDNLYQVFVISEKPLKTDKYGRYLGTFIFADKDGQIQILNKLLLENGLAKEYML